MGTVRIRRLILSESSHVYFFHFFFLFSIFFSNVIRMKAKLFGMIVLGLLVIWTIEATAGKLLPREDQADTILDYLRMKRNGGHYRHGPYREIPYGEDQRALE